MAEPQCRATLSTNQCGRQYQVLILNYYNIIMLIKEDILKWVLFLQCKLLHLIINVMYLYYINYLIITSCIVSHKGKNTFNFNQFNLFNNKCTQVFK